MMKTIVWSTFAALFLSLTGNVSSNAFGQFPEPRSAYKLKDVIVTSYGLSGNAAVDASRALGVTLGYTEVEWTYLKPGGKSKAGYTEVEWTYLTPDGKSKLGYTEVEWTYLTLLELGFTVEESAWLANSYRK